MMQFSKATKTKSRLRLALIGPSGSGKTYSALAIASGLGGRIALIDTERGSASKYADLFEFDTLELSTFSPLTYVEAIQAAEKAGYDVLIIDSLSHAWMGKEGALEQVDRAAKRSQSQNTFAAWRDVTPMHHALVDAMLQSGCHIIGTMRSKTEYVIETNEKGKSVPRKVGMAPVQRDGLEYEFDVVGDLDLENNLIISKTRCPALVGGLFSKPGTDVAAILSGWIGSGAEPLPKTATMPTTSSPASSPAEVPNGKRPYPPEKIRMRLAEVADKEYVGKRVTEKQRNLLAMLLAEQFQGDESDLKRHAVQAWLFGASSLNDVADNMVLAALNSWLKPKPDSGGAYVIDPLAAQELQHIYTAAILEQGQMELPMEGKPE
jgi:hypothetical protein